MDKHQIFVLTAMVLVFVALIWGGYKLRDRFEILGEFMTFLKERKLWWIMPLVLAFALAGLFVVFTAHSPLGAAIYTLF
ncbi:MAG: hypothetical protein K1X53_15940 [Candidatus Sumerlaeaceae bacterium]|nr:hypothetical protein [Candidatus Sumerlaeaceae bacterium]